MINDIKIEKQPEKDKIINKKKIKKENDLKERLSRFWNMITQLF